MTASDEAADAFHSLFDYTLYYSLRAIISAPKKKKPRPISPQELLL
jgi:hypothetical protein